MAIKWDKEKIILSVAGSLATIVLGYLVWRHEQTVETANAAAQQSAAAAQDAELQQEIASLPMYTQGGGASEDTSDSGSDSAIESPPSDGNLEAILQAFFGSGNASTPTTPSTTNPPSPTPGPVGTPEPPSSIPVSTPPSGGAPQLPITVVNNPPTVVPPNTAPGTSGSGITPIITRNPSPIITTPYRSPTATPGSGFQPQ